MQSVSKRDIVLDVRDKLKIRCEFKRHLSPRTVGMILRSLPLEGRAHFLGNDMMYVETGIDSGTERHRTEFKRGDIAFMASSSAICFFLSDLQVKPMTPLGRLTGDVNELRKVASGDALAVYETG